MLPQDYPLEIKTDLATQIGHYSTAETVDDLDFTEEQAKITPQQRSYCALRVRGFSSAAACRQLHINAMAAHRWSLTTWFNPICEEERKKWFEDSGVDVKREIMGPLVGKAVDALSDSLNSEDERIRLAAVTMVFEAFFDGKKSTGRPRQKPEDIPTPPDLSAIMESANSRVINMSERIGHLSDLQIRANSGE